MKSIVNNSSIEQGHKNILQEFMERTNSKTLKELGDVLKPEDQNKSQLFFNPEVYTKAVAEAKAKAAEEEG
jgi:hypothetical protein